MFRTYFRLLGFASPISKYAIPYFFYSLFYAVFNSLTFVLIVPIMNTMFDPDYHFERITELPPFSFSTEYLTTFFNYVYSMLYPDYDRQRVLIMLALFTICISFLSNLFRYLGAWTVESMRARTLQRMRDAMFSRVMDMHVGYFSDQQKGDIISRITADVNVVQFCITNTLLVAFREPFLIIGYIAMMIMLSWELSIFSVLFLPLVALLIGSIVKRLRHPARTNQQRLGEMVSALDESLSGVKVIKSYNATDYVKRNFFGINADVADLTLSMARRQQLASPMSEFLGISAVGVVLVFGGILVGNGSLDPGSFIAFVAIFSQITRPVRHFVDQFANINQGIAAGERIFEIIDDNPAIVDKADAKHFEGLKKEIRFEDVHFSYDGQREVINNVSFTIGRGQTVALVGPSGGGKSTLSELIPRFYDPQMGRILIDGTPLQDFTQESLRDHLSIVAQETVLFNDTIAANLRMGKADATDEELLQAARIANAAEFIEQLPEGFNTNIGDRGSKLSGGQRQRLSIARAVLKNPEILILDEATSALDTESEKLVQEALNKLLKGRTSVVIAHRLSTIQGADKIIVVSEGRIAEQGTHDELLQQGGIYAKLIEMQSFA